MNKGEEDIYIEELEAVDDSFSAKKDTQINKVNILCVDDKPENLKEMETLLEDYVLEVITAGSGNEALKLMLEYDFALILLDAEMQNMDGCKTAEMMRNNEKTRHIPIILITEISDSRHFLFTGYKAGAVDCLLRPIDPNILKSKISIFTELYVQKKLLEQKMNELEVIKKELEKANRKLINLSFIDGLTKIANRRRFDESLYREWKRAKRSKLEISIIMIDIDYFKFYNDNYGHQVGDECLIKVAKALVECAKRSQDLVARYGGEEFVAVLPETNYSSACHVAEIMRQSIIALNIKHVHSKALKVVTISLGVCAAVPLKGFTFIDFTKKADAQLYNAKKGGRNRVSSIDLTHR